MLLFLLAMPPLIALSGWPWWLDLVLAGSECGLIVAAVLWLGPAALGVRARLHGGRAPTVIGRRNAPDPGDRLRAVLSLPEDPSSCEPLLAAARDVSLDVARAALRRLTKLAGPNEIDTLRRSLLDLDIGIVGDVARVLRELGDPKAAAVAAEGLSSASPAVRHRATVALREIRDPSVRRVLLHALDDAQAPVRRVALEALAQLPGDDRTVAACKGRLADADTSVRVAAVDTVASLDEDAAETLRLLVDDREPRVRAELGSVLHLLDVDTLRRLLLDPDPSVRTQAMKGLAKHPRPELSRQVVAALADENWHVRRSACDAVAAAESDDGLSALVHALVDPHPSVRGRALVALERLAGDGLERTLDESLEHTAWPVRRALIEILGKRGRSDITLRHIGDPAPDVRIAVAHSLASDRSEAARAGLHLLAGDDDADVRNAAVVALAPAELR